MEADAEVSRGQHPGIVLGLQPRRHDPHVGELQRRDLGQQTCLNLDILYKRRTMTNLDFARKFLKLQTKPCPIVHIVFFQDKVKLVENHAKSVKIQISNC